MSGLGGVPCSGGGDVPDPRGLSGPGGVCSGRGSIPACTEADTPPVNRMTNSSKNITLATTSLRLVIKFQLRSRCRIYIWDFFLEN